MFWAVCSVWSSDGGALHYEAQMYLPYHLSGRPLLSRIFDSKVLDQGMYQARELSYVADAVDCRFIALSTRLGFPHFLSLTYYVCAILIAVLLWRFLSTDLGLDRIASAVLVLVFLFSPVVFLSGGYFRSSKILVCLFCMLLVRLLYPMLASLAGRPRDGLLLASLGLAGALSDRQGFYLLVCLAAFLVVYWMLYRSRAAMIALAGAAAACAISLVYNYLVAPELTLLLNGYWPSFWYQHLPWPRFLASPAAYVAVGARLFAGSVGFLFGNVGALIAAVFLVGMLWCVRRGYGSFWWRAMAAGIAALIAMDALMVLRHGALVWEDLRRTYYWLPQILLVAILAGAAAPKDRPGIVRIAALLILALNLASLPGHRAIVRTAHGEERTVLGARMIQALRTGDAPPDIAANPVYRALRGR